MAEVIDILTKVGAILPSSHFVGTSGLHFDTYINKDFLYPHTKETSQICKLFAEKFKDQNIEVVIGPALGGIILSQWTAHHLSEITGKEVLGIYTEKNAEGEQIFTRGYENYVKGKRVLVVEDIVTTGGSIVKSIKTIKEAGGNVVAGAAMVNKNKDIQNDVGGVPFHALSNFTISTFEAKDCPMCVSGVPIDVTVGHGKKYLESKK